MLGIHRYILVGANTWVFTSQLTPASAKQPGTLYVITTPYLMGSQPGVHIPLGVHLHFSGGTQGSEKITMVYNTWCSNLHSYSKNSSFYQNPQFSKQSIVIEVTILFFFNFQHFQCCWGLNLNTDQSSKHLNMKFIVKMIKFPLVVLHLLPKNRLNHLITSNISLTTSF